MLLSFCVEGPPVPKARPRMTRGGHAFTPRRTRDYEELVRYEATEALARMSCWVRDNAAGYRVRVEVYRAAKRGDLDNFIKSATDALNGLIFDDDRRIVEITGLLFDDKKNPRMLVEVEAIGVAVPEEASSRFGSEASGQIQAKAS